MRFANEQAASRIILDDRRVITKCDQCREMHGERRPPTIPPCDDCMVVLREENEDTAMVYIETRGQLITAGMGQPIGISIPAIKIVMDLFGVRDQRKCLKQVKMLFNHFQAKKDAQT